MRITVLIPRKLENAVRRAANNRFTSRSEWVRQAIIEKLERESNRSR